MAHNEWELLQTLINCIDDERNDIYVHIDSKVRDLPELKTRKAGLHLLKERVNVYWGDLSVVQAEYNLFKTAAMTDVYQYYHLLSGVDLPLKSQNYIHKFFERNKGKEFIGMSTYNCVEEVRTKACYWHMFPHDFKNRSLVKHVLRTGFLKVQKFLHLTRNETENLRKGTQWVSVTDGFVRMMLSAESYVMKTFSHTFCPDEIYKQTLCWNSGFRQRLYDYTDEGNGCMRAIGWKNGELIDWGASDYEQLKSSPALFARKFNSSDSEFINRIVDLSR